MERRDCVGFRVVARSWPSVCLGIAFRSSAESDMRSAAPFVLLSFFVHKRSLGTNARHASRRNLENDAGSGNFFEIQWIFFPDRDGVGLAGWRRGGDNGGKDGGSRVVEVSRWAVCRGGQVLWWRGGTKGPPCSRRATGRLGNLLHGGWMESAGVAEGVSGQGRGDEESAGAEICAH
jgi:hypothetical protein